MSKQKKRNVEAIYALSPMQQGMLFHSLYDPEKSMYAVQFSCTLSGKVSPEALQQAWQEVVNRHAVLRTFFVWKDLKEPVQIVRQHVTLPWLSHDWSTLDPTIQAEQLAEFLAADLARGFDLQEAPLMRIALIRLEDDTHQFVWSFHHLLLDGWSTVRVINEVFTFYEELSQGRRVELGAVRPYRDYIRWLREQEMGAAEQFWRKSLKGFSAPTALGIERRIEAQERSEGTQQRYVEHQVRLTAEATAALQQLARTYQVTLNTVVQGAWALLLSRYSGSEDVVFGATVSGRPASLAGVEEMVGMFINTLPVRVDVKSEERVGEYLRCLQEQQVEVRQYEYSPLVEVQGWSEVPKGMPLFETWFAFENYPVGEVLGKRSDGFEVHDIRNTERGSYPLALMVIPFQELTLKALYDSRKYNAKTITRMIEHLEVLLQGIVERPTASLAELSLLTETERRHLLLEWNETAAEYSLEFRIHQLFEAQVRRSPDAIAARSISASLTFAELDQRANQLAHYLLDSGIGPEAVVALLLEHSCETLIAILGVLKAGCSYLPLDPSHPPARMAFALTDAEATLLITTHSLAERLGSGSAAHLPTPMPPVLSLDRDWQRCATLPATAPALPSLSSSRAVYLIYTSGSTGIPKGVVIEHASLVNYISWAQSVYPTGDCALYSSLAFDLTVTSLFLSLVTGHILYLYPQQDRTPALLEVMKDNRCEVLKLTPSHLALIRDSDNRDSQIRCLIVGGEALSTELAHAVSESFGHQVEIYNEYGPTEATVGCMIYCFDPEREDRTWVPIGRPAANTQIYILDQRLAPTAEQVPGELYIGGVGVARGYLGRAELTAERFVPDPFSGRAGGRLYRTGDRARRLADGNIEYLGRGDEQVKYNGYRVELNELRLALSAHARVLDAVVVLRKDGAGGQQLVGYYVGPEAVAMEELRRHMQERVIAETVPQWFVHLRELPLTLNGKVNVEALPAPWVEESGAGGKEGSGEPRTEIEAQLVAIWREVLGREQVRIDDNLFELGGDSILSIKIVARANRAGLKLLPRHLFQHPTVAGLATVAGTAQAALSEQKEVSGAAPLTPIERWFFEQELAVPAHYNLSLLLQTRRPLQVESLRAAVRGLLRQHDALRLRYERGADGWRQWHAPMSEEMVEQSCTVIELSSVADEELPATITTAAEEVQRSLNLEAGPLLRVVWLETCEGRSGRLLLVAHHLLVDGVSWRVLLEDLERGYEQAAAGQAVELGAKTSSYREWAEVLVAEAERGLGAAEEEYWTEVARAHVVEIPGGEIAGGGTVRSAQRVEAGLSAARTRALLQEVPAAYNTQINDVLVTALARTLSWWTTRAHRSENGASAAVLVEMEGHGREEVSQGVDVSRTVGWFTSIYPVVLESKPAEEVGTALKRIKEQLRAVPRRGLGFGLLRYLGSGETSTRLREMRRAQVGFNYLGQLDQVVGAERWLELAGESAGAERDASGQRVHAIEVNGYVVGGELRLGWEYDGERYQREEMELVAGRYKQELEELIAHCVSEEAGGFTPSDFPLADLSQPALDRIAANGALISDIYTLAPLQAGLLFHSLYTPSSGEYFVQLTCTLSRTVSPEALRQAWQEVVNRHDVLRTYFVWQDLKEPVQILRPHVSLPWRSLDWRALDSTIQAEQLAEFLAADLARGFDLQEAPLMRIALIRLADDTHQFVWSFHHLLLDGWSTARVINEVFTFYEELSQGRRVELGAVRPYRDYIRWLCEQEMGAAEQFWRKLLKGFSAPTALGIERRVRTVEEVEAQYEDQAVQLTVEATAALQQLARSQQVTLNTVVQGAWALLLSRYSGSEDVVFGATVSGRPASLAGVEEMVGMFINTLPVRVQLKSAEGVGEYLQRLQEQQVEVRQYEYSPLVEVQGWSEVGRGVRLFDTIMVFENYPVDEALRARSGGIEVHNVHTVERTNYPLALIVLPGQPMVLILKYNTRRYEPASITRLLQHLLTVLEGMSAQPQPRPAANYRALLESIVADAKVAVASLRLLRAEDEQQLIYDWNETWTEYPQGVAHELFVQQVERTPHATAVVFDDVSLTFAELNQRSNLLASYLQSKGVGADTVVGVMLERSVEMLVAVVGVLKAGGAYLPLDPEYPSERRQFMLADADVRILLTQEHLADSTGADVEIIRLDTEWQTIVDQSVAENPRAEVTSDNLAYVIYTSGSTGQPKGVAMPHRPLVNLLHWQMQRSSNAPRTLQFTSLSFDVSFQEIFSTWCAGGTLVLMREEARRDAGALWELLIRERIERLFLPFVALQYLAETSEHNNEYPSTLREVITAGEQLKITRHIRNLFAKLEGCTLDNHYGPSETHVVSALMLTGSAAAWPELPAIGRPIANTQMYLLDERLQVVPVGVAGELYIGGEVVARGYLNRAAATAEKFLPHPFMIDDSSRLYRTGDQARYLADGNIEFLGRRDQQVKVRGYRIELGEVEAALRQQEQVREAVVISSTAATGELRLIAYVLTEKEATVTTTGLRGRLREWLPEYMMPAAFVLLESIPLTPSGKIDRRALQARPVEFEGGGASVQARTPAEEILAAIWAEVLGRETVSVHDNFFELGGHSLLATQVISRVWDAFGQEVALRSLFEQPTVAGLAREIEAGRGAELQAPPLERVARVERLPLSFAQQRLWFLDQMEPGSSFYNISAAVRLHGVLNVAALERTLSEVVRRHEVLRTHFVAVDGEPVQVIEPAAPINLELLDLSVLDEAERTAETQRLVAEESAQPFDLTTGPLLRVSLLRLQKDEDVALVTMHHIVSDGWSVGVLMREVAALYSASVRGEESPLEELPIQYADFAHWQRHWLQGEVLAAQLDYWRAELADAPTAIDLPIDKPRPPVQTHRGASQPLQLSTELSAQLRDLSRRHGSTLFMTLLSAFDILLCRYATQEQVLVGIPIANRNRSETEGLIGFFINTLVLRGDLRGNPSFGELLRRVRETALGAYAHQGLPFEKLVEELQPERDMSRSPLFQVMFILQNAPSGALELEGLSLSAVGSAGETAKFDLTLALEESGGVIMGGVEYNRDLYAAETIGRMVESYERVLQAIVIDAEQRVFEIDLLIEAERQQLIEGWNETAAAYPRETLSELFEAQAARTPEAVALLFEDTVLSYRELNEHSNQLARYLQRVGAGPEMLVGILMQRSVEMIVGVLGILKAGGAYVPLDPSDPHERVAFMVQDSGMELLLTHRELRAQVPELEVRVLALDEEWEQIAAQSVVNLPLLTTPDNLAYVIYTSGSTGKPKGVQIQQRSLINFLTAMVQRPGLTAADVLLSVTSLSFDIAGLEIFLPLLNGARVVVASREEVADGRLLMARLEASGATVMQATPATWSLLLEAGWQGDQSLQVLCGGEALGAKLARELARRSRELWNLYGPTETTIWSSLSKVNGTSPVTLGVPVANTQFYVLDRHLQPVPMGVVGELYIAGEGLARGYLQRPELTAEKFVVNPFSTMPGARMYRTGDLVRYRSEGELEYLGRLDHQVKVRGFRIELGEIEAVLSHHPAVREAVVTVREDQPGDKRLTGYIVAEAEAQPDIKELRHFLRNKLPNHMIPTAFMRLDSVPLNSHGKVERGALPAPNGLFELDTPNVPPRTEAERNIARVWQEVLGLESVGIFDNFFDLGGHSLLMAQVRDKLRERCKFEVSMVELFEYPSINSLAEHLSRQKNVTPIQDENLVLANKLREGRNRLRSHVRPSQ